MNTLLKAMLLVACIGSAVEGACSIVAGHLSVVGGLGIGNLDQVGTGVNEVILVDLVKLVPALLPRHLVPPHPLLPVRLCLAIVPGAHVLAALIRRVQLVVLRLLLFLLGAVVLPLLAFTGLLIFVGVHFLLKVRFLF